MAAEAAWTASRQMQSRYRSRPLSCSCSTHKPILSYIHTHHHHHELIDHALRYIPVLNTADTWPRVDLRAFIVKSNDDLRQEMVVLQLMRLCHEIWNDFGLQETLWLKPYRIVSTGMDTGLVEVLQNAMSVDALKKVGLDTNNPANGTSLPQHFHKTYGHSEELLALAKKNFVASLAAYSIFSYLLQVSHPRRRSTTVTIVATHIASCSNRFHSCR